MADVLKQTLYFNVNPTESLTDINGTGASVSRTVTAAESHDANDATYEGFSVTGDGFGTDGNALLELYAALQTASAAGAISFVRVKARGRVTGTGGSSTWTSRINGTQRGTPIALSGSFADYSQDFATDPADGLAWTNAKLNAQTFGVAMTAAMPDANTPTAAAVRLSEFSVEVWGPSGVTLTPSSVGIGAAIAASALVAGLAVVSCVSQAVGVAVPTAVLVPGAVTLAADSVETVAGVSPVETDDGGRDPSAVVPQASFVDGGSAPVTVRSNTSPLGDQNVATSTSQSKGLGVGGATGSLTVDGHGGATTSISGTGAISGVVFYAIARGRAGAHASFSNWRLANNPLLAAPPVGNTSPPFAAFDTVRTDLVPLDPTSTPWSWDTLAAQLALAFAFTVDYAFTGGHYVDEEVRIDVAEIWCEVHGPVGSEPEVVQLKQKLGNMRRVQPFPSIVSED